MHNEENNNVKKFLGVVIMKKTLSNRLYDVLKWIVVLVLPSLGTLYFALSKIWGFPYGEEVVGTISAITVFLGTTLKISTTNYNINQKLMSNEKEE